MLSDSEDEGGASVQKRPKITDSDHEGEDAEEMEKAGSDKEDPEKKEADKGVIDSSEDEGVGGG